MWTEFFQLVAVAAVVTAAATLVVMLLRRQRAVNYHIAEPPPLGSDQFARSLSGILQMQFRSGNKIELLENGEEVFPAMFDAVGQAQRSITFENYVYWSGEIGREFAQLLGEKARDGVPVHVILDWVGAKTIDRGALQIMLDGGVEVHQYHPPRLGGYHLLNHRTHRRELIIDGRLGFTGGVGVADEWKGDGTRPDRFRDNHYSIEGPLVADMQSIFMDNWLKLSGNVLHGDRYFPTLDAAGNAKAGLVGSSPHERMSWARLVVLMLLNAAQESVHIEQAYFVPDPSLTAALAQAARRGVQVELILPGQYIDFAVVRRASRCLWGPLLEAGVRIYEYQPGMLHTKVAIADGQWMVGGSLNLDYRSLYRNDETILVVHDREFCRTHLDLFAHDLERSQEITLASWQNRSMAAKAVDRAACLLRTQL